MAVAHAAGEIGVELAAAHQRAVPVDMDAVEGDQLVEDIRVLGEQPREVHQLGEAITRSWPR
jgi:hypothetical protein